MFGSNFSTSLRKLTFFDFCRYPGSDFKVTRKKRLVKKATTRMVMTHSWEGMTRGLERRVTWEDVQEE